MEHSFPVDQHYARLIKERINHLLGLPRNCTFPGSQPVSLIRNHLDNELLFNDYVICEKTDGIRYLLYLAMTPSGPAAFIINRKGEVRGWDGVTLPLPSSSQSSQSLQSSRKDSHSFDQFQSLYHCDTLIDGEIVNIKSIDSHSHSSNIDSHSNHSNIDSHSTISTVFLAFDILLNQGKNVCREHLYDRLRHLQNDILEPFNKREMKLRLERDGKVEMESNNERERERGLDRIEKKDNNTSNINSNTTSSNNTITDINSNITSNNNISNISNTITNTTSNNISNSNNHSPISFPFKIEMKTMYKSYHLAFLLKTVIPSLNHENDGLILTPVNESYEVGTCRSWLKWKPPHLNTVDFHLYIDSNAPRREERFQLQVMERGEYSFYSFLDVQDDCDNDNHGSNQYDNHHYQDGKHHDRNINGNVVNSVDDIDGNSVDSNSIDNDHCSNSIDIENIGNSNIDTGNINDSIDHRSCPYNQGAILECKWNPNGMTWNHQNQSYNHHGGWSVFRQRFDKSTANAKHVVENILLSMRENITMEDLVDHSQNIKASWDRRHAKSNSSTIALNALNAPKSNSILTDSSASKSNSSNPVHNNRTQSQSHNSHALNTQSHIHNIRQSILSSNSNHTDHADNSASNLDKTEKITNNANNLDKTNNAKRKHIHIDNSNHANNANNSNHANNPHKTNKISMIDNGRNVQISNNNHNNSNNDKSSNEDDSNNNTDNGDNNKDDNERQDYYHDNIINMNHSSMIQSFMHSGIKQSLSPSNETREYRFMNPFS